MNKYGLPLLGVAVALFAASLVFSQGAGSAYSSNPYSYQRPTAQGSIASPLPNLDRETAKEIISIQGTAEIKVVPDKIRLVFGVIANESSAKDCSNKIKTVCQLTTDAIKQLGIASNDINQDFISVTPVFDWKEATLEKVQAIKQVQTGFQMQSNLHVLCENEAQAMQVIGIAFENGISDIIAFDYWSAKLDDAKKRARKLAVSSAKSKATEMFAAFDIHPRPLNIEEHTTVHKPAGLYRTFSNSNTTSVTLPRSWRDRFQIHAPRPKLTYLENLEAEKDVHPETPSMRPEICVLSKVRVYYEAPQAPIRLGVK